MPVGVAVAELVGEEVAVLVAVGAVVSVGVGVAVTVGVGSCTPQAAISDAIMNSVDHRDAGR